MLATIHAHSKVVQDMCDYLRFRSIPVITPSHFWELFIVGIVFTSEKAVLKLREF